MDIQKIIIYIGLFFIGLMLWGEWQKEQSEIVPVNAPTVNVQDNIDFSKKELPKRVPSHFDKEPASSGSSQTAAPYSSKSTTTEKSRNLITITTNVLELKIDRDGGVIVEAKLLDKFVSLDKSDPYKLFNQDNEDLYLAEMGVVVDGHVLPKPIFVSALDNYRINEQDDKIEVKLTGILQGGIFVERTYTLSKDKHLVEINTKLSNNGNTDWSGKMYYQLVRKEPTNGNEGFMVGMNSYVGAAISDESNKLYEKISFSDISKKNLTRSVTSGWVAMVEHYFLTAFIPENGTSNIFYSQEFDSSQYTIGYSTATEMIKKGSSKTFTTSLYIGPENSDELKEVAKGLELTIDYGWLSFIASFLFTLLNYIHMYVGNWGWAIILLTVLMKLVFYKLSATSYRSMAKLKKFQPKMMELKERFGSDKQKLNKAMMEMYKKEKINPLGGCLPILVQIPVFLALYWALLASVEIRHSPFIFWIGDLSSKDPFFVLPVLMGGTMFLQQRMSPPPADPIQAKVMSFLPVMFTFLFISVPAGLVLYWTVNNMLSIIQQWYITRKFEAETVKK